jgi:RHS repeat-associated protein
VIDSLGRLIATEGPDPGGQQVTLSRNSWGTDSHGSFAERSHRLDWSADLWHWERVYTDGLGREFRKSMPSADGRGEIVIDRVFGSSGEVLRESLPCLAGETPLWVEHSYDILGRAIETSSPAPRTGRRVNRIAYPHVNREEITECAGEPAARTSSREYAEFGEERCLVKSVDASGAASQYDYDAVGRVLTATDPAGVVTTSRYDTLGRRVSMRVAKAEKVFASETVVHNDSKRSKIVTTAKGNRILLEHDTRGRLIRRAVSGEGVAQEVTSDVTAYKYAGDRLARVEMPGDMTYVFAWDATGNVSAEDVVIGGRTLRIARTYTPTGKVAKMVYPDGAELQYRYTPQGQLAEQTLHEPGKAAKSIAAFSDFTNAGRPRSILYGNGLKEELAFNRLGQIESQRLGTPAGANPLAHTEFNWDNFDQLAGIVDRVKSAHSQAFAYDTNGRLIEARWNAGAPQTLQEIRDFAYDAAGNVISKNGVRYSYQGHQLVEGRKQGLQVFSAQYDADGGMAKAVRQDEATDYQYDGLGRLTGAKGAKFLYDHSGRRVMKQSKDATTWYVSPDYEFTRFAAGGEQTTRYIPGDSGPLAQITTKVPGEANASAAPLLDGVPAPGISYFHTNLINSTSVQTDGAGAVLATITYEPFGEIRSVEGRDGFRPKFTGKEFDHETGLYYFNSRYYDPVVGRFLSADDRPGADLDCSGALNRYAYVLNNPVTGIDFDGHFRWDIFADVLIGIAAVTLLVAATVATGGAALAIGLAASTLLGAAISGSFYSATHSGDDFSWSGWGIELGIGAATGLISGAVGGVGAGLGTRAYVATVGAGKHFLLASGRQALGAVTRGVVKQVGWGFAKQVAWSVAGGVAGGVASQFAGNSLRNAANGLRGWDAITTGLGPALAKGAWQGAITGALGALPLKPKFAEVAGRRAWAVSSIIKSGFASGMTAGVAGLWVAKTWADYDDTRAGGNTSGGHRATQPAGTQSQAPLRFTPLGLVTS